jgi:hypothetical protein
MATNTDTIPVEKDTATRETTRAPKSRPPSRSRRAALVWPAIIAACIAVVGLAVATFTGGDDKVDIPATRFDPQAEQYEWDAHLEGQAKTHGGDNGSTNNQAESNSTDDDPYDDGFVTGSRHMPMR